MRPIIAVTGDSLVDPSPIINLNYADMAPQMIKNALLQVGGTPIIVPFPEDPSQIPAVVQSVLPLFSGLVLPGGPDIDPTLYHEEPRPHLGRTTYPKDLFEQALIKATLAAGKPILAICRGLQILNVTLGGSLYQDLATQGPAEQLQHAQTAPGQYPTHHIQIKAGSTLEQLMGSSAYVNSRHHQAVRQLAPGLKVVAQASDGIVEAVEDQAQQQILALQWHPENMWPQDRQQLAPFQKLVDRAQVFREKD
ncbi:gamma-glutamyl-gamma-aminobutyrate hydrolase family protein [Lactobacillus sp. DCY120]|uniref:Gamma-glutamyl-gamma-aminobutyrate hydrolase family protein n=1 Tax=Bombilactobacillus apium TaxID=2675299 RepID=A0A850R154_9LACO|nr:gamma-glutamyl-gamma-aminobutyrate hydrolase family protein [Bombilactobacillus apium]NVY96653.1 gamma-glutamyl-gamma-aminobutyrate hydrolase family protein [Bombilactobacillus apium]